MKMQMPETICSKLTLQDCQYRNGSVNVTVMLFWCFYDVATISVATVCVQCSTICRYVIEA